MNRVYTRPSGKPITDKEIKKSFDAYHKWYDRFKDAGRGLAKKIEDFDTYKELYINAVLASEKNIARKTAYEQLNFKVSEARATFKFINEDESGSKYIQQLRNKFKSYEDILKAQKNDIDFQLVAMKISPDIWDISPKERDEKYGEQLKALRSEYEGALYKNESIQKSRKYTRLKQLDVEEPEDIRWSDFYA